MFIISWLALCLPGFLISFVIGALWQDEDRLNLKKITLVSAIIGLVSAVLIITAFWWALGHTNTVDHFSTPMTVQQARDLKCPRMLPDEAKNVRFGQAEAFQGYEYLVRFEAPVSVCRAHVKTLWDSYSGSQPSLQPLTERPMPMRAPYTMFGTASWFDVENIIHGEMARFGPDTIWIDDDRGIFYYQRLQ